MYRKVSIGIITILVTAAILTVPSSMLQVSHAQSTMQGVLATHNGERTNAKVPANNMVGNPALTWSDSTRPQAQTYADQLKSQGYVCNYSNDNNNVCKKGSSGLPHGATNENSWAAPVIRSTNWSIAGSLKSLVITPKPILVHLIW